jgi:hypothetical protein
MITVATFDNQADAHIAKGRLEAEGLSPVLGDNHLVQTDWLYSAALGGIKLQVPSGEAERARQLLDQDLSAELEALAAADTGSGAPDEPAPVPATDRWAGMVHMAALAGAVVPFGHLLGPLAVWLWRRAESPAVDRAGREAVNFQLSATLYAGLLALLLPAEGRTPILVTLFSLDLILVLVAGARSRRGLAFRYPLTLRLMR